MPILSKLEDMTVKMMNMTTKSATARNSNTEATCGLSGQARQSFPTWKADREFLSSTDSRVRVELQF